jgi:pilus assembly protein Flp/PilA
MLLLFIPRERGQGLVEYALILTLVVLVVIVVLTLLGPAIGNVFSNIVNAI